MHRSISLLVLLALAAMIGACTAPATTPTSAATAAPASPTEVPASPTVVAAASATTAPSANAATPASTPTSLPPTAAAQAPTAAPATASGPTSGQLAEQGKAVYASSCASCHGDQGQGGNAPALIGANQKLSKYQNAQKLLEFVSKTMPRGAPGSLSKDDYLAVLSFLLLQNEMVQAGTVITADALPGIQVP
jgi:mono/diheme cytochrome c family protein